MERSIDPRGPGGRWSSAVSVGLPVGQEADQVLGQELGLLECREVTSARHHGEALDGKEPLGELAWRDSGEVFRE